MPPDFKDQKQFYCDQCPDVFLTKHSLHLHRIKWHPTGKDLYQVQETLLLSKCTHWGIILAKGLDSLITLLLFELCLL